MKIKKKKIRIAILASNVITIPPFPPEKNVPEGWSGAPELVVHYLTEELVRRGHYVTLFASGDSKTKAKLVSVNIKSSWNLNKLSEHFFLLPLTIFVLVLDPPDAKRVT